MEKKELINLIDETYKPIGYKKRKNIWLKKEIQLSSVLQLEASRFNKNRFYINYGFIINSISLEGLQKHILGCADVDEKDIVRINDLLLLDNDIPNYDRKLEINLYLEKIKKYMQSINSEEDLYNEITNRSNRNNIPLIVKNYFNLD